MRPASGCSNPPTRRRVVVLPQPDGPSRQKNSPPGTSRSIPSTATTSSNCLTSPASWTRPPAMSGGHRLGERREVGQEPVDVLVGVLGRDQPLLGLAPGRQEH